MSSAEYEALQWKQNNLLKYKPHKIKQISQVMTEVPKKSLHVCENNNLSNHCFILV